MVDLKGWNFRAEDGFSGSRGKSPVQGYMRGGHVKAGKAVRHETKHHGHGVRAEHQHKHNHGGRAKLHPGHSTPLPYARGGKVHRSEEHKDYKEYNAPRDEAEYPEVSDRGRPAGYKKGGHHKHHYAKGGKVQGTLRDPHESEPFEAAKRGGRIMKKAHGGHVATEHKHNHGGKHHAYAMGGRAMPGPVMGAKHRAKVPMVSAARSPLAAASPMGAPAMGGGMGLKRGGRA